MAKNIYENTLDINNNVNVNSYDYSHVKHITTDFGRLTPVLCIPVPAKSTFRCNLVDFGLQLFPTAFPVQTPMRCRLNFFKMEERAAYEDYPDMVSGVREDLEFPYVALPNNKAVFSQMFGTSKLSDYLGIPSKVPVAGTVTQTFTPEVMYLTEGEYTVGTSVKWSKTPNDSPLFLFDIPTLSKNNFRLQLKDSTLLGKSIPVYIAVSAGDKVVLLDVVTYTFTDLNETFDFNFDTDLNKDANMLIIPSLGLQRPWINFGSLVSVSDIKEEEISVTNTTIGLEDSPIHLNAIPFRIYEAIYNQYYRDSRNNPYILNGRPEYNKVLPTRAGGPDSTVYKLHYANWEKDAFTTAVPNPQQGLKAPLAGLTTYTTSKTLEDGQISTEVKTALVTDDGKKYALDFQTDDEETALTGVTYTELTSSENVRPVTTLSDLANSGLSIETLRYVNAYQKFLELNMRKGYSYRDIMQGRWDIDIRFDELLLPTFIGGVSREINVNAVTQTVDNNSATDSNYESALGSQAGILGVYGASDNNIEVFCDESSYIMAVLTVVPTPIYSQLTPKHFFYRDLLDQPQPEFQNIGFQPILKRELNLFDKQGGGEVFGYQRPWYEYCQQYDTCHGAFRDTMGNFLMKRTFYGTPELSKSFLQVDPRQLSDVFSVTKVGDSPITDKIYGYIRYDITCKLPINRVAIPRLD